MPSLMILKAPLRAINGFAHLFEQEMQGQLTDRAREHLARMRNGSVKMATLIDDLLSYSHIDRRGMQVQRRELAVAGGSGVESRIRTRCNAAAS